MVRASYGEQCLGRMQRWMTLRGLAANSVSTYRRCGRQFLAHVNRLLTVVTRRDIEAYLHTLVDAGRSARTRNVQLSAIRCLLRATVRRDATVAIPRAKVPRVVPQLLSGTEIARLLAATTSLKYRAIFTLAYGAGLRVGEITTLRAAPPDFLFPVHVLGKLFRGKFLAGLTTLLAERQLDDDADDRAARRRRRLYDQSWVVYAKRPFGGPQQVFRYLGHYTHRVAIANRRLVHLDADTVVFRTRGCDRTACPPVEFIRRFLEHVLPPRFVKIRHFGLFAAVHVRTRLAHARHLLATTAVAIPPADTATLPPSPRSPDPHPFAALLLQLTGIDLARCPLCRRRTMVRHPLPRECRGPPRAPSRP